MDAAEYSSGHGTAALLSLAEATPGCRGCQQPPEHRTSCRSARPSEEWPDIGCIVCRRVTLAALPLVRWESQDSPGLEAEV